MTVGELIQKLVEYPLDMEVAYDDYETGPTKITHHMLDDRKYLDGLHDGGQFLLLS